jgi:hypothetical protein
MTTQFACVTGPSRAGATGEVMMRYLFGFLCACAIGLMSTVGCGPEAGVMLCEGVSCEDTECRTDGVCDASDGMCDYTPVADGTECGGGFGFGSPPLRYLRSGRMQGYM